MEIQSLVYPKTKVHDQVLIDLINSKPMQRLKKINVAGYHFVAGNHRDSTRFEHSLGVMVLLRIKGASLDEQIAGLLHDVAHTAFSHVSTYALQKEYTGEEFHEIKKEEFINKTEIPGILRRHSVNIEDVLNEKKFSLLENDLPDICADRIDYSLRDGIIWQFLSKDRVNVILDKLITHNGSFVFNDIKAARYFADNFFELNKALYGSAYNAYFNHKFGEILKYAMRHKIIPKKSWFKDDYEVLSRLQKSNDPKIIDGLKEFDGRLVIFEDNKNPKYTFTKKLRVIDPPILKNKKIHRLSVLDKEYLKKITIYQKEHLDNKVNVSVYARSIATAIH